LGGVWGARHLRTGRRYAVKTLLSTERFSRDSILRFEREARAASAIGHAGIVGVHDFDRTDDGVHFLVMDLLVGETLEARLGRAGRLSWGEARQLVLETCEALEAAHRSGVLHRDLKPGNVFLAQIAGLGERAVLVDFGLAKPIEEGASQRVTSTGAVVGTALYMSPEQTRGEKLDVRSDVYGLAAVIYETLTGVPPFLGPSALAVMTMVLAEQPVPPSMLARGLPAELDHALLAALSKHADDRPKDVATLAASLSAIDC
jgi:serine/threonine protein kinase